MKKLKTMTISMMVALLSIVLISETQATSDCEIEKDCTIESATYQSSANRIEEGIVSYHLNLCLIHFCNTSYGEMLEPGVFPVNTRGNYRVELAQTSTGWEIIDYEPIPECYIY